ncbi:hypothetical protein ACFH4J_003412 [Escherichia coli]|uniref:hypothetical protein n=1 Tax=Enterobacter hormaechei TaxID=158836 RepID=UPI0027D31111|nr:hypothetical protein [Enterobacter hormaechei]WLZ51927.1 hypothetical protein QPR65_22605 [Enterobacter hormaechei]
MKQQRYPASIIKVGAILYKASGWTDDEGKCHLSLDEWHVRSIQNRTISKYFGTKRVVVSIAEKQEDITWQKDKWLKNFPSHYRNKFYENDPLPRGLYTTPNQALRFELESTYESIKWYEEEKASGVWSADHETEYNGELKLIKVIKARITRLKNSKKNTK